MHINQLAVVAACMALTVAPASAEVWKPVPPKPDLEYLVDSVHRIGVRVYLMHRGAANRPQGSMQYEAPIEFDCADRTLRMPWGDIMADGRSVQRAYGKSVGRYAPMQFASAGSTIYGEAILQWACSLPVQPERLVNIGRTSDGKLVQVDSRSVSRSGTRTSLWTRYDYPEVQFDPPYDAPYDSKREFVEVDCEMSRFRIAVGYDFTPEGAVTDNMIARDSAETPFDSTDAYEAAVKSVACGEPVDAETYAGIGGETRRVKAPLAPALDIDSVSAPSAVVADAQRFAAILPARPAFKSARIVETMKASKTGTSRMVISIRPIQSSPEGLLRVRETYSPDFYVDRDMQGLVQLKSKMNASRSENRSVYVTQALTIKASDWREGGDVSFVTESANTPGHDKPLHFGLSCKIGAVVAASTLNSELPGQAWQLDCTRLNGDPAKGYYVEALGYFLPTHEEGKSFGTSDTTVDSVTIEK